MTMGATSAGTHPLTRPVGSPLTFTSNLLSARVVATDRPNWDGTPARYREQIGSGGHV